MAVRSELEVAEFEQEVRARLVDSCGICYGADPYCECYRRCNLLVRLYEAEVPREFWDMELDSIRKFAGLDVYVVPYAKRLKKALRNGYGLCFQGGTGSGKSLLVSLILKAAIRRGRTAYYIRAPDLETAIRNGWKDARITKRLNYLLTSDFVGLDDLGAERFPQYVTELLKQRSGELAPVLLGTELGPAEIGQRYTPTIASILAGRYGVVPLFTKDGRARNHKAMTRVMGYKR